MKFTKHNRNGLEMAEVVSLDEVISSASDFLDIMGNAPSQIILLHEDMLHQDFFELRTGLAGDILQKVSNYQLKLGIIGDFTKFTSKALRDFIYESNETKQVYFADSLEKALETFGA